MYSTSANLEPLYPGYAPTSAVPASYGQHAAEAGRGTAYEPRASSPAPSSPFPSREREREYNDYQAQAQAEAPQPNYPESWGWAPDSSPNRPQRPTGARARFSR
jgi:hypothetical protein